MNNENARFQPYVRRRAAYRSWLKLPNPIPPPSTARRFRARAQENLVENNAADLNVDLNVQRPVQNNVIREEITDDINNQESTNGSSSSSDSEASTHSAPSSLHSNHGSEPEEDYDNEDNDDNVNDSGPFKDPNLEDPLFPGADCNKFECLLMILSFSLRHGLSQTATQDLCSMINSILRGDYIPTSKYMLRKIFGKSNFSLNFYCKRCQLFIIAKRHGSKMDEVIPCRICGLECRLQTMNDGHFFVTFPVQEQLKFLLENTENVMELLDFKFTRPKPPANVMRDIYDGKVYAELSQEHNFLSRPGNLSLTVNTDGVKVFDRGIKKSIWPIFFRINEFPPSVRFNFNNCLLAGLWFAESEPNMHLFFSDFVQELDDLYETGFTWKSSEGIRVKSKAILLNCVADSKARPKVQNCKCHNGYYGCGYCDHPGKMFDGSNQAKYPMSDNLSVLIDNGFQYTVDAFDPVTKEPETFAVEDRSNEQIRIDMDLAEANRNAVGQGDIKGVQGKSILMGLPYFDLVFGFPVDYLHAVLLGTTKHVTELWFDSSSHGKMYYVGRRINIVDRRLKNITPPVSISRRPRVLSQRGDWHGNEWRSWLLYYSLPCLDGVLPRRYLRHHCLLVSAIFLLLGDEITVEDMETATYYLGAYCREFGLLYSEDLMYFNVHLLLHLGKCVDLWGPLFTFSAFPFEGANGTLVKLVHGSTGVLNQIAEKYTKSRVLPKVISMYEVGESTLSFCEDIMTYQPSKVAFKFDSVTTLGSLRSFPLEQEEREALVAAGCNVTSESYERMVRNNVMYHARCYVRRGEKSDSSVVQLLSGQYGVIERILDPLNLKNPPVAQIHILLRDINTLPRDPIIQHPSGAKAKHIIRCTPVVYGHLRVITANDIKQLAILMDCIETTYVTTMANLLEKD